MDEHVSYQKITLSGSIKPGIKLNGRIFLNTHLSGCIKKTLN